MSGEMQAEATRIIALDTETTGLEVSNGHRIIELGCVEMIGRKLTGRALHLYFNPERAIDAGAQAVHGISIDDLHDKPVFGAKADEIVDFLRDAEIVIHNAAFDVGFLNGEFARVKMPPVHTFATITDSLMLARAQFQGKKNSLDALCDRLGVDNSGRTFHGALLDAQLLAEVYLALTRGQGSLSIEAEEEGGGLVLADHSKIALNVIRATPDENAAHEKYLETLAKKSKPLWPRTEGASA